MLTEITFDRPPSNGRRARTVHRQIKAVRVTLKALARPDRTLAEVLGMSRRTIYTGLRELEAMGVDGDSPPRRPSGNAKRIRRPGGGRPEATQRQAGETSAFVCEAIALTWEEGLQLRYSTCTEIVLTFDAGGANAARSLRFKEDLVALSACVGLPLRVAHYPPYTSKWHPIEHRLFSRIERALRGVNLDSPGTALQAVERPHTETGLQVKARLLDKVYDIGRKCSDTFRDIKDGFIHHADVLGPWSYVVDARGFT